MTNTALPSTSGISGDLLNTLHAIVGKRYVMSSTAERLVYESDACLMMQALPDVVVLPKTSEEVAAVVTACVQANVPFTPRGSGTGLTGGSITPEGGVLIGLSRLNQIEDISPEHRRVTVGAGVINIHLNAALAPYDLFYAPDPSSQAACSLGGNLSANAGGIHCVKYGVTTDHVLALEVVLPDGTLTWVGHTQTRRQQGPNLAGLLVGSEGTLGIITRAVLRVLPKPRHTRVYLFAYERMQSAAQAVAAIVAAGLVPSALEYIDAFTVKAVNAAFDVGFPEASEAVILVELDGHPEQVEREEHQLFEVLLHHPELSPPIYQRQAADERERLKLWKARKGAVAAYGRILPAFYLHDCVVPRSQLPVILQRIDEIAQEYQMVVGNVFHAGDGNLHPNILFDPEDKASLERLHQGGEAMLKACLEIGGTISGEHGIGLEKVGYMPWVFNPEDLNAMQQVRAVFNPKGLSNPGKLIPQRPGCGEVCHHTSHPGLQTGALRSEMLEQGNVWI